MTTFTHLRTYIRKQFTLPVRDIAPHHRLQQDLGLNDIEQTEVIVYLEGLFEVTLPDELLTPSLTVGQLCTLINQFSDEKSDARIFLGYAQGLNLTVSQSARIAS